MDQESGIKRGKKTKKRLETRLSSQAIIQKCRGIAGVILNRIETMLDHTESPEGAAEYMPLIGSKKSVAETLVTLAELVAILDKAEQSLASSDKGSTGLAKEDEAILKRFRRLHASIRE